MKWQVEDDAQEGTSYEKVSKNKLVRVEEIGNRDIDNKIDKRTPNLVYRKESESLIRIELSEVDDIISIVNEKVDMRHSENTCDTTDKCESNESWNNIVELDNNL